MILNNTNLQAFGKYMQSMMGLDHWDVDFKLVDNANMRLISDDDENYGYNYRERVTMYCIIYINSESQYKGKDSWEATVIHELGHLIFDEYESWIETCIEDEGGYRSLLMERTIDRFSRSIYRSWANNDHYKVKGGNKYDFSKLTPKNKW